MNRHRRVILPPSFLPFLIHNIAARIAFSVERPEQDSGNGHNRNYEQQ